MKNYSLGKTTNERFARRATNSMNDSIYSDSDPRASIENDSLLGSSSRNNSVGHEANPDNQKKSKNKKSKKSCRCGQNWKSMMCNRKVIS